jgi:erythronate-4-phosphate dehydrogenase
MLRLVMVMVYTASPDYPAPETAVPAASLRIVADENMPSLNLFAGLGNVITRPGRAITAADLAAADVLLVRSVTRVNAGLLAGTPVRFVGSATIGTDHIDAAWLQQSGIAFAHAPGCNAMAVAEYALQSVLDWLIASGRALAGLRVGVLGCGNVGARVAGLFRALGVEVLCCDPPRAQRGEQVAGGWRSLREVLDCDVVTLHVPLSDDGECPTRHLVGAAELARLGPDRLLINTCRGPVIDNQALLDIAPAALPALVLDVWEHEPRVPEALFRRVRYGTPHIAGYSVEGRRRGTEMVYAALQQWCGRPDIVPEVQPPEALWSSPVLDLADVLALLASRYRLADDHAALAGSLAETDAAAAFDRLRKQYPPRHELAGTRVTAAVTAEFLPLLSALGVAV